MVKHLINRLIITAGQWKKFDGKEYEQQFESLFESLQKVTGASYEQAEQMVIDAIEGERVA